MNLTRKGYHYSNICSAVRDSLDSFDSDPEFSKLALECAYLKMLELFNELGFDNPSIRRINEMQARIQELAQQNRDFRGRLGLPEEELTCRYTDEDKTQG